MKFIRVLVLNIVCLSIVAQDCVTNTLQEEIDFATSIFIGKIVAADTLTNGEAFAHKEVIAFTVEVEKQFINRDSLTAPTRVFIYDTEGVCPFSFEVGQRYLIYSRVLYKSSFTVTGSNTPTKLLSDTTVAEMDLIRENMNRRWEEFKDADELVNKLVNNLNHTDDYSIKYQNLRLLFGFVVFCMALIIAILFYNLGKARRYVRISDN